MTTSGVKRRTWVFIGKLGLELLVVVAGILIAIQLENRRQSVASRQLERDQIAALRTDLLENQARLDAVRVAQDSVVLAGRLIVALHLRQLQRPPDSTLVRLVEWACSWYRLEPVSRAYDAMVSSGDVTRVSNADLLRALAALHGDLRDEFEDQAETMAFLSDLRRLETPYGLDVLPPGILRGGPASWRPRSAALDALIADREFAATVALRTMLEVNRADLYARLDAAITRILDIMDGESAAYRAR